MAQSKFVTLPSGALRPYTPVFVDTIEDLRSLTEAWPVVHVNGHTSAEDGGGGEFRYLGNGATPGDIAESGEDDDGWHIVNSSGLIWGRVSDVVTPQMFGAFPSASATAARSANDQQGRIQRSVDFWAYPKTSQFPGIAYWTKFRDSLRWEMPSGLYRCEDTVVIQFDDGYFTAQGYNYQNYYTPGTFTCYGSVFTPYENDVAGFRLSSHRMGAKPRIVMRAYKDRNSSTGRVKWDYGTYPQIYYDDDVCRTWTASTAYLLDEEIKYTISSAVYIFRCTLAGTTASTAPSNVTGTEFTDGTAKFKCIGSARLSNGKSMNDILADTTDIGIHIDNLWESDGVECNALNYMVAVAAYPRSELGNAVGWNRITVNHVGGCMVGVLCASYLAERKVNVKGRLSLQDFPIGGMVWETGWPYTEASWSDGVAVYDTWDLGASVSLGKKFVYTIGDDTYAFQCTGAGTTSAGEYPTASDIDGDEFTSGTADFICLGGSTGIRYRFDGPAGGESTSGNWTDLSSVWDGPFGSSVDWTNDNEFEVHLVAPYWSGATTITSRKSQYGVVVTSFGGDYSCNNNSFGHLSLENAAFTAPQPTDLTEAAQYLLYCANATKGHSRNESPNITSAVKVVRRVYHTQQPRLNYITSARAGKLYSTASYRLSRLGGYANVLVDAPFEEGISAEKTVLFSESACFSSYDYIHFKDQTIIPAVASTAAGYTDIAQARISTDTAGTYWTYHPADDSWSFNGAYPLMVMVDLSHDEMNSAVIRVEPILSDDRTLSTSVRYWRWIAYAMQPDGQTKVNPYLFGPSPVHRLDYDGGILQPVRSATYNYIYHTSNHTSEGATVLGAEPWVKKLLVGIFGMHIRGFRVQVNGTERCRIYSPLHDPATKGITDTMFRVVDAVPEKGLVRAPAFFRYRDGTGTNQLAQLNKADGVTYHCTSGQTSSLTPGNNLQWGHNGLSQGSATISEWDGSAWQAIATNAYYVTPADFTDFNLGT